VITIRVIVSANHQLFIPASSSAPDSKSTGKLAGSPSWVLTLEEVGAWINDWFDGVALLAGVCFLGNCGDGEFTCLGLVLVASGDRLTLGSTYSGSKPFALGLGLASCIRGAISCK
jgi:hypothetical protein